MCIVIIFITVRLPNNAGLPNNVMVGIAESIEQDDVSNVLTLYRRNNDEIETCNDLPDGNKLLTKFVKKEWGTWNIAGWYLVEDDVIPSDKLSIIAAGGTDWEYVFRVAEKPGKTYEFSGGNHSKEKLENIRLLFNNEELSINVGDIINLDYVEIIECTSLYMDNKFSKKYADVERKYTIKPSNIIFSSNFKFTRSIYMGTSYVCMMPVLKNYGRYIKFGDSGNVYNTPKPGNTLTTNKYYNYLGKEKTLSVKIWGDKNPNYKLKASIDNYDMIDNFKNELKVFYWDCNIYGNKLYFSKFNNDKCNKIMSETIWNNKVQWELIVNKV